MANSVNTIYQLIWKHVIIVLVFLTQAFIKFMSNCTYKFVFYPKNVNVQQTIP